jgi:hypothetical protein
VIIHVAHMLLAQDTNQADRIKLAELTAQLQAAMDEGRPLKPPARGK